MKRKVSSKKLFIGCSIIPAIILFVVFMVIPTINVFWMSLFKWGGLTSKKTFVGFDNFKILLEDQNFLSSFKNTLLILVVVTLITLVLAIIIAAVLSRENVKFKNFFRVIFYLPNILSVVVISAIFSAILDPNEGIINATLDFLSLESLKRMWLGDHEVVIWCIIFAMIWQAVGYYMVMYMSSMCSIPESLYEAAELEGASKITQFFKITLPLIWNVIRTTLTFFIISTINLSFLFVKVMTGGGPDGASEVFLSYMYKQAYSNSAYGYGMAIGVVIFLFSFGLSFVINKATKRDVIEF
ncbi:MULTISPECIES: carbohydrate ABC transporter permease [Clostridium]|uniref:Carbohydrate ABC transporter membrane protein 1, CUT1 family n=1 Tax=Clostridium cadaveris TaxID=1529 RepID=A0A1I2MV25_9CLOT|nr:sugar ABC transporter permease [Clostridium cadaveris]MDU4951036.1 sugar ABC transporter permease [Clostridium sp.]MDM8311637.1 sugar ABC transporter permease [Clostridium cadaveris]MDY4948282.1 sugar ABC transporter permease [Clostridium cadaveris]NME65070.1 sugar ABC transporter permease [Clostridium cadaveris]PWL52995.1 MAG: sugar ABC transporter permease [Clostridium cadaveris]